MTENFANNARTTLNGAITNSATTLVVSSAANFPSVNFRILIDGEIMLVTNVSSTTFTVTRGAESTTAASHADGAAVTHILTAGGLAQSISETGIQVASLSPSSDTYINQQATSTNYDSSTTVLVGNAWGTANFTRFALFTFDTSSLVGKTIYLAWLRLVRTDTNSYGAVGTMLQARRILRAYSPTQVTWNVYSTGNNWTTAGAESNGNDVEAEVHGGPVMTSGPTGTNMMEVEIARLVQADLDASSTTLRIIVGMSAADGTINPATFSSQDNATAGNRPKLLVLYH